MSARARAERLAHLYKLRAHIEEEIHDIEKAMEAEMDMVRRAREAHRFKAPDCGTDGGYYRHLRTLKEPACQGCLAAHRQAERKRKAKRDMKRAVA